MIGGEKAGVETKKAAIIRNPTIYLPTIYSSDFNGICSCTLQVINRAWQPGAVVLERS